MNTKTYDYTLKDAMAMPVTPVEPADFDLSRYEGYAAECDQRYAKFLDQAEGIAVWQRVRAGEVFRDACRDMQASLRWQLGALAKSLDYLSDAPTYLEPWYGIGTTASAFGADYTWPPGQAPVVKPLYATLAQAPDLVPAAFDEVPILRQTLAMIEYFLAETGGRLPLSWADLQAPLNVASELINLSQFFMAFYEAPERVKEVLAAVTGVVISFTQKQSELIGPALARPGHGFASSRAGTGIGLSSDNLIMLSPEMVEEFCLADNGRIGGQFGGLAFHSCGNWGRWLDVVKKTPHLLIVDGAFSPETDPAYNKCEVFRDALVNTGIILQARIVGDPDEVLARAKRLWQPGLRLIVVTHVQDPLAQRQLYQDIHHLCS